MKKIEAIAFDMYGTLYDVHSVVDACEKQYPGKGKDISVLWRQKQLEYAWLRCLMGQYIKFEEATANALTYACNQMKLDCDEASALRLTEEYLRLKPFPEVRGALRALRERGMRLAILSNGSTETIHDVVHNSGVEGEFEYLISVDAARVYKPHPLAYELGEEAFGISRESILFVSSNPWDVSGAKAFGYKVCWINRYGFAFDELGQTPDFTVPVMGAIVHLLAA